MGYWKQEGNSAWGDSGIIIGRERIWVKPWKMSWNVMMGREMKRLTAFQVQSYKQSQENMEGFQTPQEYRT